MNRSYLSLMAIAALLCFMPVPVFGMTNVPSAMRDCKVCHTLNSKGTVVKLRLPITQLCMECHSGRTFPAEHTVDVKPTMNTGGLPLDSKGNLTCTTCHEPHGLTGKVKLLRAHPRELCTFCHNK